MIFWKPCGVTKLLGNFLLDVFTYGRVILSRYYRSKFIYLFISLDQAWTWASSSIRDNIWNICCNCTSRFSGRWHFLKYWSISTIIDQGLNYNYKFSFDIFKHWAFKSGIKISGWSDVVMCWQLLNQLMSFFFPTTCTIDMQPNWPAQLGCKVGSLFGSGFHFCQIPYFSNSICQQTDALINSNT